VIQVIDGSDVAGEGANAHPSLDDPEGFLQLRLTLVRRVAGLEGMSDAPADVSVLGAIPADVSVHARFSAHF
jgi:hypothetical protein